MNRCTFTETITFEKFINEPHYDEIKDKNMQIQCENMTDEQFDEYGRAYCKKHRIKVDEINKSRHKNCINKEKLINELRNNIYLGKIDTCCSENVLKIIIKIKNGEFD